MTDEEGGLGHARLYEEARWRYAMRRYAMLAVLGVFLLAMAVLVAAILMDYFFGWPDLGARDSSIQSWAVLIGVGGGGMLFLAYSLVMEIKLTRRASIGIDVIVLGRGKDGGRLWSPLGSSPGPARIAVPKVRELRIETFDPMRTFPTYRWYRAWRAQFELSDGSIVSLDPSVDGFFHPLALEALLELASYLREHGVEVEVREGGPFSLRNLERGRPWSTQR